jgi:predicted phosphodiesterase
VSLELPLQQRAGPLDSMGWTELKRLRHKSIHRHRGGLQKLMDKLKFAHISDIHFDESSDGQPINFKHDLGCLKKIQLLIDEQEPDYLLVTGDITNLGDKISLQRAYQWIHDRIYVDGDYYGLECDKKGIIPIIVPGNHDAFNAPKQGKNLSRWQKALGNYYAAFPRYGFDDPDMAVDYSWLTAGSVDVLVCRADSCYLGDTETEHLPGALLLSGIAKGKISRGQSEEILRIYDKGIRGELRDKDGAQVAPGRFMKSLKILVMHHYLFEPANSRAEPLLQMHDKRSVFQNLAMSDFDVLICGHKHVAHVYLSNYLEHFDARGKVRYAFNHVRRSLGMASLPIAADVDGTRLARLYRFVVGFLYLSKTAGAGLSEEHANEIIQVLERSIQQPSILKAELLRYVRNRGRLQSSGLYDEKEIHLLHGKIVKHFTLQQRKELARVSASLRGLITRLAGRPFAHITAASSAKASETNSRKRAVNFYEVFEDEESGDAVLNLRNYGWDAAGIGADGTTGAFSAHSVDQKIVFRHDRTIAVEQELL